MFWLEGALLVYFAKVVNILQEKKNTDTCSPSAPKGKYGKNVCCCKLKFAKWCNVSTHEVNNKSINVDFVDFPSSHFKNGQEKHLEPREKLNLNV